MSTLKVVEAVTGWDGSFIIPLSLLLPKCPKRSANQVGLYQGHDNVGREQSNRQLPRERENQFSARR